MPCPLCVVAGAMIPIAIGGSGGRDSVGGLRIRHGIEGGRGWKRYTYWLFTNGVCTMTKFLTLLL